MKKLFKRISKIRSFTSTVCWLIACYIRLVYYTNRISCDIEEGAMPYMHGKRPAIFSFWHGRLLMMPMICPPGRKMHVLISSHRDGAIISGAMNHFNFGTISGSSTRGGGMAAIRSVKTLQAGENVSITPDGPRGPAMRAQPGIITIAEMARMPVICVTYASSRNKRMKSWDRFMLALPFGRIYYKIGILESNITQENLDRKMLEITHEVDTHAHAEI